MKVTIFGGTGKTGRYLINEGLKRGAELTIFARTNSTFDDPRVHLVRGELTDKKILTEAICGADAVLSALGPTTLQHPANFPISSATLSIIEVMKLEKVDRLIAISTGTAVDSGDGVDYKIWFPALLIRITMPNTYKDIIKLAEALRASDLDWTMVRVGFLTNALTTKKLNVGLYAQTKHSLTVSRADVAEFMFDQIADRSFIKMAPGISD